MQTDNKMMRDQVKMVQLVDFYTKNPDAFINMCDIVEGRHQLSLRCLDFVCSGNMLSITSDVEVAADRHRIRNAYLATLRTAGKGYLDAFRRQQRNKLSTLIDISLHDRTITTTIAQMLFFKLGTEEGIIEHAQQHLSSIEREMTQSLRASRSRKRTISSPPKNGRKKNKIANPRVEVISVAINLI